MAAFNDHRLATPEPRTSYFDKYSSRGGTSRLDELVALQRGTIGQMIHLIASACYPFDSVMRSLSEPSCVLPAEGRPGQRYLPGAAVMDLVEVEGEQLLLKLFDIRGEYRASLQPHSGTQANQVVYNTVLRPNDTVLCLKPNNGGHISHTVVISRRHKTVNYGLTTGGLLDYDQMRSLALEHQPRLIIVGGSALPRSVDFERCASVAHDVGALLHADVSHTATFLAAGLHPDAFPHCDFATFSMSKNLRGPNGGLLIYRSDLDSKVQTSIFPTTQGGANENMMLAKFACLQEWQHRDIKAYAERVVSTAQRLGHGLSQHDLRLVTGGTDSHQLLLDLRGHESSGALIEARLESLGVLVNKNLVPDDPRTPQETSGLRIGSANLAILGYENQDLDLLADWLARAIVGPSTSSEVPRYLADKYQSHLVAPVW